jgi:pimeloyl-ACP methyl ester carboxylesterase
MRGRGQSARDPEARYDIATYTADVIALLDALGLARALFVGTSMGGLITVDLATQHPARVAGAVINDIGPELAPQGLARIAMSARASPCPIGTRRRACATLNADVFPHYDAAQWLAMARRLFREEGGMVVADYDPAIAQAFGRSLPIPIPGANGMPLPRRARSQLLRGTQTDLLEERVAEAMVAGKPQARLVPVPGIGHAPMLDEPAAQAALADFLAPLP